jgi:RNA polymerase sigma factor (TIGR02999 family)
MRSPTAASGRDPDQTATDTVTRLLADFEKGDDDALEAVFPLVYGELREIAHRHRRHWSGDTTLGTTALINEAYLRLVDADRVGARTRVHFLRVASRAMRQILSNYGRDQRAAKRGGAAAILTLDSAAENAMAAPADSQPAQLADLADALDRLEKLDARLARVVECRFFGGLSIEETAETLDISPATVKRDWLLARAWLYRDITATV